MLQGMRRLRARTGAFTSMRPMSSSRDPNLIPNAHRTLPHGFSLPLFAPRTWRDDASQFGSLPTSEALPGMPVLSPGSTLTSPQLCMDVLPSGLKVASQETYGQVCTLALFVEAGSMYERAEEIGACHFLEAMAFKSTRGMDSDEILRFTQQHGITTGSVFNQEVLLFKVDALRGSLKQAIHLLAEAVFHPRLGEEDMDKGAWLRPAAPARTRPCTGAPHPLSLTPSPLLWPPAARKTIAFQRDEANAQPSVLVAENLWSAAYGADSPQGRPEKCPPHRAHSMSGATLRSFAARTFVAPRMVLAGVGVTQRELMDAARDSPFFSLPSTPASALASRPSTAYLGGEQRVCPDWASLPPTVAAATSKTKFTHIMLAFPTVGWSEDATVPLCVTDTLLGGGSSFSAGGPGKGMYSRLYREALNEHAWVESANAFSTRLYKCGMVGIYGTSPPEWAGDLAQLMCSHLARLGLAHVKAAELSRARNQLASSVLMNLETRSTLVEDIGRQLLSHGKRMHPADLTARIQRTTAADIRSVMREAMAQAPALSIVGDASRVPAYQQFRVFFEKEAAKWSEGAFAAARQAAAGL